MENNNIDPRPNRSNNSRVIIGLIIILLGFLAFIRSFDFFFFPGWILSWPMILIIIGLVIGSKNNFQKPASYILIFIGVFFLLQRAFGFSVGHFIWPIAIIAIGFYFILGNKKKKRPPYVDSSPRFDPYAPPAEPYGEPSANLADSGLDWDKRVVDESATDGQEAQPITDDPFGRTATGDPRKAPDAQDYRHFEQEDFIDSVSIFGAVKKIIFSKNFKGGDVVNIMGGTDINLINADIKGPVVIDLVQLFGGCTIIVPSHWKIYHDMSAVFGEVDDKRMINPSNVDSSKTLYIKGVTLFGGVTIKGF